MGSGACGDDISGRSRSRDPRRRRDVWSICTVIFRTRQTVPRILNGEDHCLGHLLLNCMLRPGSHTLVTQPNQTQPMKAPETDEGSGNLFRSRSRLGPVTAAAPFAADSPHLSAGGVTKKAHKFDSLITRLLLLMAFVILPPSDAVVGASGSGRRPAFHLLPPVWFREAARSAQAVAPCVDSLRPVRNPRLPGMM